MHHCDIVRPMASHRSTTTSTAAAAPVLLTIRPRRYRRQLELTKAQRPRQFLISMLGLVALGVWRQGLDVLVLCTVLAAALAASYAMLMFTSRIELSTEGLRRKRFGLTASVSAEQLCEVVHLRVVVQGAAQLTERTCLLDHDGRVPLAFDRTFWPADQIDTLCGRLALPVRPSPPPLTGQQTAKDYPGALGWWEARPWLLATAVLLLAVTLAVVLTWGGYV